MRERSERLLKLACAVFAVLLLVRIAWAFLNRNPLADLSIPAVPTLAVAQTNSGAGTDRAGSDARGTNVHPSGIVERSTNGVPNPAGLTNALARAGTNASAEQAVGASTHQGTTAINPAGTNSAVRHDLAAGGSLAHGRPAMMAMPQGGPGVKLPELPPDVLARVDRITDSQLLGPVFHPLPMGLLGIAGNTAFLRAANGQTGLLKEGEELAGIKLVKIGINRVLVEDGGQKKELTIFNGYGGDSLLPK